MRRRTAGFTLLEVVIIASIISLLAGVVLFNAAAASQKSRDADRKGDLRTLQGAVELYKQRYGRYPAGCNGPGNWSGQLGTTYQCAGTTGIYAQYAGTGQYIIGHEAGKTFAPGFISVLPVDSRLNGNNSGYAYVTNSDGSTYKIQAMRTVESEAVTYAHPFKSCDATNSATGICDAAAFSGNNKPNHCQESDTTFRTSYALWGGYAKGGDAIAVEQGTEVIICK